MKKFTASEKTLKPDVKYGSRMVSKFINCIMLGGKKSIAEEMFYSALDIVAKRVEDQEPLEIFNTIINNVKPLIEVRSKRVGGATYQVPMPVSKKRQLALAMRWILVAARKKKGKPFANCLADEFTAAYRKEGDAMTVRENVHKMAEANKAFAHFAW